MFRIPSCALESVLRSDLQKPCASSSAHSSVLARMLVVLAFNARFKSLENTSLIHDVRTRGVLTPSGARPNALQASGTCFIAHMMSRGCAWR